MTEFRVLREDGKERLQSRSANEISPRCVPPVMKETIQIDNSLYAWSDWTDVPVVEAPKKPKVVEFECEWRRHIDRAGTEPHFLNKEDRERVEKALTPADTRWKVVCTEVL